VVLSDSWADVEVGRPWNHGPKHARVVDGRFIMRVIAGTTRGRIFTDA